MPQMLEDSDQCPDLKNHKKASALLSQDALLFSLSLSLSLSRASRPHCLRDLFCSTQRCFFQPFKLGDSRFQLRKLVETIRSTRPSIARLPEPPVASISPGPGEHRSNQTAVVEDHFRVTCGGVELVAFLLLGTQGIATNGARTLLVAPGITSNSSIRATRHKKNAKPSLLRVTFLDQELRKNVPEAQPSRFKLRRALKHPYHLFLTDWRPIKGGPISQCL